MAATKRTKPEELLGEWGPREGTVESLRERDALAVELDGLTGRKLRRRLRLSGTRADAYVVAVGGVPAYMVRLRLIEDEEDGHLIRLRGAYAQLADECRRDGASLARRWRETAEAWDFRVINDLIERHNRWYPIEARLAMNPRTGDYVRPFRREPLDADWILERFPAVPAA